MLASRPLAVACTILFAAACGGGSDGGGGAASPGAAGAPGGKKLTIGFSMDTLKEERWQRDKERVEFECQQRGYTCHIQSANGDDARQLAQAESLITQGVDVLLVAPHNAKAAAAIVESAHRAGVPVISYDRLISDSDVDLYVSVDPVRVGEQQAEYAAARKPKGSYILIGGAPTDNNAHLLREGQMKVLKPLVDKGDVKIVTDQWARDWQATEGLRITEQALTRSGNKVEAVVASNDGLAGAAIQALGEQKLTGVLVTGQDAELPACQRIAEGTQTMTIYKSIPLLARAAVDAAAQLAAKQPVTQATRTMNNGKKDVPSILLEPVPVDKDNLVATVIKDGYHKYEDVYKNVPADQRPPKP